MGLIDDLRTRLGRAVRRSRGTARQTGHANMGAPAVSTAEADRLRDTGQYALAAEAYAAVLMQAPLRTDIRVQYGNMLKDSGRLDEAEQTYRAALVQTPDDAGIYLQLGHALKLQRRTAAAIEAYRRAAELAPHIPEPKAELTRLEVDHLLSTLPAGFRERVATCYGEFDFFEQAGFLPPEAYVGRRVLDWEAGDCAWSVVFLLKGASHVTATDSWALNADVAREVLQQDPRFSFIHAPAEELPRHADDNANRYDFIFANTVTEHIQDLPQAFSSLRTVLVPNGLFFTNHDNYYHPGGAHDHGFWFYGDNGYVAFQGADCWHNESKCAFSAAHRTALLQNWWWTWNDELNSRINPEDCTACPYYKRSQPWAHLLWAQEFLEVFNSPVFSSGRPESTLNKVTPFQLMQYLTEAGFQVLKSKRNFVANTPPQELIDRGFSDQDLKTSTFYVLSTVG